MTGILSIFGPRFVGQKKLRVFFDVREYESCFIAAPSIEQLCAQVLKWVSPENMYLVVGVFVGPFIDDFHQAIDRLSAKRHEWPVDEIQNDKPQDLAVLVCRVRYTASLNYFYRNQDYPLREYKGCFLLTWEEFRDYKHHIESANHA